MYIRVSALVDTFRMDITGISSNESACHRFHALRRISEGAFGDVKLGVDTHTGEKVALKYVRLSSHGIPRAIFREMEALRQLKHKRVVDLIAVYPHDVNLVMVFEYMASDLQHELSRTPKFLSDQLIKYYSMTIFEGLRHCHSLGIVHRDIKPSNILVSSSGTVKLADFGLARVLDRSSDASLSHQVATRWYRAPELLYGSRHYDFAVDMWSAGAVVAELLMLAPLFPGNNDLDQLYRVFQVTGTPDVTTWPVSNNHMLCVVYGFLFCVGCIAWRW
jgi:serine/threonine protein kinase